MTDPACPSCGRALEGERCPACSRPQPAGFARAPGVVFTLIVVASGTLIMTVVAVVAARAIPTEVPDRASANEAAARGRLAELLDAERRFIGADFDVDGVHDHGSLDELAAAKLIEAGLATGPRGGYLFTCDAGVDPSGRPRFAATATPLSPGADRYLGIDESGVRYASPTTRFDGEGGRLRRPADAVPLDR